ncbi:hypothetical protein [Pseudomonas sp. HY13-MNA-CIBAN-0226]|uniref:hypothetical protein n=1 Tax=Pseudomonas sp. HY13-MNA-CIBAN-0226 TaxID=3140473 RepID=UPI00331E78FD
MKGDYSMSVVRRLVLTGSHWLLMLLGGLGSAAPVWAAQVDVTAKYYPVSHDKYNFYNTTRPSRFCELLYLRCRDDKLFSADVNIVLTSTGEIRADHAIERQGVMFKVPASWKTIEVRNTQTGESHTLKARIAGFGFKSETEDVRKLVGMPVGSDPSGEKSYQALWSGGSFDTAPRPCEGVRVSLNSPEYFNFVWMTPVDGVCAKKANFNIPRIDFKEMQIVYQWESPDPWGMASGTYVGALTYTLGAGGEFDVGDILAPSENALTLKFTLDVEHVLNVYLPPGGNRVELVPEGGWQRWLQNPAHIPKRLFRDQTFHISASGRFGMRLICSNMYGEWCAIRNENNHSIPVAVDVSLPSGMVDSEGRPVVRQALRNDRGVKFQLGDYVDHKPGTLHFETNRLVDEMLREHAGSTYSGTITVVWDSEV